MKMQGLFASRQLVVAIAAILITCVGVGVYSSIVDAATVQAGAFKRDQRLILQIVTVPSRSIVGGIQYDEQATVIHTSHVLTIPASGQGMSIQSVVDGIPINVSFSSAAPGDGPASVILHDLAFHLPLRVRTSANSSKKWQSFFGQRTLVYDDFHDFRRILSVHYTGEDSPNTFIRLRVAPANKPLPVIDLAKT